MILQRTMCRLWMAVDGSANRVVIIEMIAKMSRENRNIEKKPLSFTTIPGE